MSSLWWKFQGKFHVQKPSSETWSNREIVFMWSVWWIFLHWIWLKTPCSMATQSKVSVQLVWLQNQSKMQLWQTCKGPYWWEAPHLQVLWKRICRSNRFEMSWKHPYQRKGVSLSNMCGKILFESLPQGPQMCKVLQKFELWKVWENIQFNDWS